MCDSTMSRPSTWSSWSLDVLVLSDFEWMLGRTGRAFISLLFCVFFSVESLRKVCVRVHSGSLGQLPVPAGCHGHSCWPTTVLSGLYFQIIWLYMTQQPKAYHHLIHLPLAHLHHYHHSFCFIKSITIYISHLNLLII